ncbi:SDR family oxidoreductase [Kineococcus indalonis]|uniref:SDR family oxidoreductase n=1 Tax=Kineococcus indalonis TaxID=2696566 RepID=UPI001F0F3387|nr:SDR family oxidoreductase [Kineococcus indalonis]
MPSFYADLNFRSRTSGQTVQNHYRGPRVQNRSSATPRLRRQAGRRQLPALREAGPGSAIVNISSGAALTAPPLLAHYGAAEAALNAYGKALATELAPAGIRVTTVVPGTVLTPGADAIRQDIADARGASLAETTADVVAANPLGRPGDPCDVAEAAAHLASDRAQRVTGVTLTVDGGQLPGT